MCSLFAIFFSSAFSKGSLVWLILKGPVELLSGLVAGILLGCVAIPLAHASVAEVSRNITIIGLGLMAILIGEYVEWPAAGAITTLVFACRVRAQWSTHHDKINPLQSQLRALWPPARTLLFSLVGASLNLSMIQASDLAYSVVIIMVGVIVRSIIAMLSTSCTQLSLHERLFVALAWIPKATVQAALATIPLQTASRVVGVDGVTSTQYGEKLLTVTVISILICAPLGAIAIALTGPRWLHKSEAASRRQ